ncbi:mechanosensitive ion channel family protein [Paraburkholderia aspalathi]|uniref:mechanosensitive ion channel family protein n=1 Tax=Paraburkholderia aspalathi TaxID=1324617 RepID=UPI0038BAB29B
MTSGPRILLALVVIVVGLKLSARLARTAELALYRIHGDKTLAPALGAALLWAIRTVVLIVGLGQLGVQTASLIAVLGAAGLAIGLALQGTLQNIAAGIMLLVLRPLGSGDLIESNAAGIGFVDEIGLFATRLSRGDGVCVYIPNAQLWSQSIVNYSRNQLRRIEFTVGISYEDNVARALNALEHLVLSCPGVLPEPRSTLVVSDHADSAVVLMVRAWTQSATYWDVRWKLLAGVKPAIEAAGCSIAYPVRDLRVSLDRAGQANEAPSGCPPYAHGPDSACSKHGPRPQAYTAGSCLSTPFQPPPPE